jgi:hypothetical protein
MKERLIPITFYFSAAANKDPASAQYLADDMVFTKISHFTVLGGSTVMTDLDATIEDDGTSAFGTIVLANASAAVNAIDAITTPVKVARGSLLELVLAVTGGSSPTSEGVVTLWGFLGEG